MKMNFLFTPIFWGGVLILWGLSMIINTLFHINIPVFRIVIALVLIFLGLQMLFGWKVNFNRNYVHSDDHTIFFGSSNIKATPSTREYNVIFGKGDIDITEPNPEWVNSKLEINTVFGFGLIRLNPEIPVKIVANAAFGKITTPDSAQSFLGDHVYQTPALKENQPYLLIKADVVFGDINIELTKPTQS